MKLLTLLVIMLIHAGLVTGSSPTIDPHYEYDTQDVTNLEQDKKLDIVEHYYHNIFGSSNDYVNPKSNKEDNDSGSSNSYDNFATSYHSESPSQSNHFETPESSNHHGSPAQSKHFEPSVLNYYFESPASSFSYGNPTSDNNPIIPVSSKQHGTPASNNYDPINAYGNLVSNYASRKQFGTLALNNHHTILPSNKYSAKMFNGNPVSSNNPRTNKPSSSNYYDSPVSNNHSDSESSNNYGNPGFGNHESSEDYYEHTEQAPSNSYGKPETSNSYVKPAPSYGYGKPAPSYGYGKAETNKPAPSDYNYSPVSNNHRNSESSNNYSNPGFGNHESSQNYYEHTEQAPSNTYGKHTLSNSYGEPETSNGYGKPASSHGYGKPAPSYGYGKPETNKPALSDFYYSPVSNNHSYSKSSNNYGNPGFYNHESSEHYYEHTEQAPSNSYGKPETSHGYGKPASSHGYGKPVPSNGFGKPASSHSYDKPVPNIGFGKPAFNHSHSNSSRQSCHWYSDVGVCVPYFQCRSDHRENVTDGTMHRDILTDCPDQQICCLQEDYNSGILRPNISKIRKDVSGYSNPTGRDAFPYLVRDDDKNTQFGEFPWIVAIMKKIYSLSFDSALIGAGTLIHPSVVMTSAHILITKDHIYQPMEMKCRAGEYDTQSTIEFYKHQERYVEDIVCHDDYDPRNLGYSICLMFLKRPYILGVGPHIAIALLNMDGPSESMECYVTGWEKKNLYRFNRDKNKAIAANVTNFITQETKYINIMRKYRLSLNATEVCEDLISKSGVNEFRLDGSQTCARGARGTDLSSVTGGAPLVCRKKKKYLYSVFGIATMNRNIERGQFGVPVVFTNVTAMYPWIQDTLSNKKITFRHRYINLL